MKSTVHRVIRPPEDQASKTRLSLIYFARPEAAITLEPVRSPLLERLGLQKGIAESLVKVTAEGKFEHASSMSTELLIGYRMGESSHCE